MTSTSWSLVSASAGPASRPAESAIEYSSFLTAILPSCFLACAVCACRPGASRALETLDEVGPQVLDLLQTDVESHGLRRDAEVAHRVRAARLLQAHLGGKHQAFMAAPADAKLEQLQGIAERARAGA